MNGMNVEKVYRRCLKMERDRERSGRDTLQGAFEASFVHIDYGSENSREDSPSWLSDNGRGVEAIVAACDGEDSESRHMRCIKNAREKLRRAHPELVEVFNLIVKNGSNRKESIWQLMSRNCANGTPPKSATGTH